jgi:hypothetical protein
MAALRQKLPANDLHKADALGKAVEASQAQDGPTSNPMPEVRGGESPSAPVTEDKGTIPSSPTFKHQRAEAAATAKMQEAVKSTSTEVPLGGAATPPPSALDTSGMPERGVATMAPTNAASNAAQNVMAMLGAGATALAAMKDQVATVGPTFAGTLSEGQQASGTALAAAASAAVQGFSGSAAAFTTSAGGINRQSATGFARLGAGNKRSATTMASDAETGFTDAVQTANDTYAQFGDKVEENFVTGRKQTFEGLWSQESRAKLASDMIDYGTEAAKHVQPRWKKVLKWVITIVVIVAVIAVTVLSAGALGPVGVVLLGATLGAAAGAVQTIATNLIDDRPWSEGVVKAMIVGAIGGAVGGVGGVLLKGVGSTALRVAFEGGVNIVGGVAGKALGSVAVGEPINWTGALMGALVGAGIGAGLGIAGAIRGRIKIGGIGEPAAPPPPRPTVEPTPPAPVGRIRSALEATKILKPRAGAVAPEVNVGAEPAPATPSVETPGPTPAPSSAAEPTPAPSPAPEAAPATARPPEAPGVQLPEPTPAPARVPEVAPTAPRPPEPTGVQPPEPAPTPAPATEAAPTAPRPPEPTAVQPSELVPSPVPAESAPPL